jgi:hypothetical protein
MVHLLHDEVVLSTSFIAFVLLPVWLTFAGLLITAALAFALPHGGAPRDAQTAQDIAAFGRCAWPLLGLALLFLPPNPLLFAHARWKINDKGEQNGLDFDDHYAPIGDELGLSTLRTLMCMLLVLCCTVLLFLLHVATSLLTYGFSLYDSLCVLLDARILLGYVLLLTVLRAAGMVDDLMLYTTMVRRQAPEEVVA